MTFAPPCKVDPSLPLSLLISGPEQQKVGFSSVSRCLGTEVLSSGRKGLPALEYLRSGTVN
jgi:hypothetical protein